MNNEHDDNMPEYLFQPEDNTATPTSITEVITERRNRYGTFIDQASLSVALKRVLHSSPNWKRLAPDQQEALEMNCVKISRILMGDPDYVDNWRDIEGYARLVADRLEMNPHEF